MRNDDLNTTSVSASPGPGSKDSDRMWPIAHALYDALTPWRGRKAFVVPIVDESGHPLGNNGDELMMKVFWHILAQAGVNTTEDIQAADVLFVPPNGALLQMYKFPELLQKYTLANLRAPMIIFPSSANFPTKDPSFIFEKRSSEVTWILREQYSFDHLRKQWGDRLADVGCELVLDHDVVASHSDFVRGLFGQVDHGRPLVGARKDVERNSTSPRGAAPHSTDFSRSLTTLKSALMHHVATALPYGRFYTGLVRALRAKAQKEAGAALIKRLPEDIRPEFRSGGVMHRDVSSKHQVTFNQYLRTIANAGPVATDRLHIALPAAILGKDVWLVEGGYHKATGVVNRSASAVPNLRLVSNT
ncbi:hypothetical protein [Kocuria rosea]|uniref:hypothetical protein n=1 Tax=Kocuria rosea TaxID=1275 RepID=UPI002B24C116|nr:hypothetical protein [Kocuria rosea]MEB2526486.1 hypothetical protein [Kocuria rosea]MEB2619241.1 hypothetical protein [Kocuria rosea]